MTLPTITPLGASTLVRKWKLDVDTSAAPHTTPAWVRVMGIGEFKPTLNLTTQDDSDFDSDGDKSTTATARQWGAEFKVMRKSTLAAADTYDVGQELLRLAAEELGTANSVHVRFYEDNGADGPTAEAYEGYCSVDWSPDGGGMDALETVSVVLGGQGRRTPISNPAAA